MKHRAFVYLCLSFLMVALSSIGCNSASNTNSNTSAFDSLENIDYMQALSGLKVHTTSQHPEFAPPILGGSYPDPLYEPMVIGMSPPGITGSLELQAYGQSNDCINIEIQKQARKGQTFDILIQSDHQIYWRLQQANSIGFSTNIIPQWGGDYGLTYQFGFFYENKHTEVISEEGSKSLYSTALRIISDRDCTIQLDFANYVASPVNISYSMWTVNPSYDLNEYWAEYDEISGQLSVYTDEELAGYYQELYFEWRNYLGGTH